MDVIWNFYNKNGKFLKWKHLFRSCLFCLALVLFGIRCLPGEICFDFDIFGTDLAYSFQVIVCHLAEPVNLVFEWGNSSYGLSLREG